MGKWTDKDTADHSGDSLKDVARAEHQARDDATKEGIFERGNKGKNSERFSKSDNSGERASGFWSSVFGRKD